MSQLEKRAFLSVFISLVQADPIHFLNITTPDLVPAMGVHMYFDK